MTRDHSCPADNFVSRHGDLETALSRTLDLTFDYRFSTVSLAHGRHRSGRQPRFEREFESTAGDGTVACSSPVPAGRTTVAADVA